MQESERDRKGGSAVWVKGHFITGWNILKLKKSSEMYPVQLESRVASRGARNVWMRNLLPGHAVAAEGLWGFTVEAHDLDLLSIEEDVNVRIVDQRKKLAKGRIDENTRGKKAPRKGKVD